MNTQAMNIGRQQEICRSDLFNFEYWQKDNIAHVHGRCNIICGGAWMLWLWMDYLIFYISFNLLEFFVNMMKVCVALLFYIVFLHLQFNISDDIRIVSISFKGIFVIIIIIIIINKIIWFFIWLFIITLVIILEYITSISNNQSLWLDN